MRSQIVYTIAVPDEQDLGELHRLEMKICTAFVKLGSELDLAVPLLSFCMLVGKVTEKLPDYCYAFIEFHKGYDAGSSESGMPHEKRRSKIPRIPTAQPKSASHNLQVATKVIIFKPADMAAQILQAKTRICRIGQEGQREIAILVCHNTIDQTMAARTESKYIPIIAGSCGLEADRNEVETAMREDKLEPNVWADNYEFYNNKVISDKASRLEEWLNECNEMDAQ